MKYFYNDQDLMNHVSDKNNESFGIENGHVYFCYDDSPNVIYNINDEVVGVIQNKKLIENADTTSRPCNGPEVSFNCLQQFYTTSVVERMSKGKIKLVDKTESTCKYVNKNPGMGYTKIYDGAWHKSGHIILHDKEKNLTMLFGQDENQYFGVELPKYAAKVESALKMLMPKQAIGKSYMRQGEWFAVPVNKKEVPKIDSCLTTSGVTLMLETEYSNKHNLDGEIRIKDNVVFARKFRLMHNQHKTMTTDNDKWYAFYKNNAVRSFSEDGVD